MFNQSSGFFIYQTILSTILDITLIDCMRLNVCQKHKDYTRRPYDGHEIPRQEVKITWFSSQHVSIWIVGLIG